MKTLCTTISLFLAIIFTQAQQIVNNGSMDTVIVGTDGDTIPQWWTIMGGNGGESTTDSYSGLYAVRIYNFNNDIAAVLMYGPNAPNHAGMPILTNPISLNGYYKFILGQNNDNNDTAQAWVWLTRFDQLNGVTDTVGSAHMFLSPQFSYQQFTMPINYGTDSLAADTLQIRFESSISCNCTSSDNTCCHLYLDQLWLEIPSGIIPVSFYQVVSLNYDASFNQLTLSESVNGNWSVSLIDATGREVIRRENVSTKSFQLDRDLPSGIYLYRLHVNGKSHSGKLALP